MEIIAPEVCSQPPLNPITLNSMLKVRRDLTKVLIVDDQQSICKLVALVMEAQGFSAVTATSGPEALNVAHAYAGHLDLLCTDYDMPGMDGATLAQELRVESPGLPVILMSGSFDPAASCLPTPWRFLPKPFSLADLAQMAHALVGR